MMVKAPPVRSIIDAVARAASAWSDSRYAPRRRAVAAVTARSGYSPPVVEYAFDRLFRSLGGDAIAAVVAGELGSLEVLDGFVNMGVRGVARALPVGRVCVISSRTTIGVAIVPAIFALCAKCEVLVKDREDHLVAAFFATLTEMLPQLEDAVAARPWLERATRSTSMLSTASLPSAAIERWLLSAARYACHRDSSRIRRSSAQAILRSNRSQCRQSPKPSLTELPAICCSTTAKAVYRCARFSSSAARRFHRPISAKCCATRSSSPRPSFPRRHRHDRRLGLQWHAIPRAFERRPGNKYLPTLGRVICCSWIRPSTSHRCCFPAR